MSEGKRFSVSAGVVQAILNYLQEKPYKEVWQLILALQAGLKEIPEESDKKESE